MSFSRPARPMLRRTYVRRVRLGRSLAFFLFFLRALALVAGLQVSGLAHAAGDAVAEIMVGDHPDDDDDHESDPNHECPPGCPTCHHVHFSGASLPPSVMARVDWARLADGEVTGGFYAADAPAGPALPPVYRPPRA